MTVDLREVKRLARQGLPHPDPAVRAAIVTVQRRWYRLMWYPTIVACAGLLAAPVFFALAWETGDWPWLAAAPLTMIASGALLLAAFGLWAAGARTGWLAAPNLPRVPPAPLPLRVPSSLPRSPLVLVALAFLLMAVEWVVIAFRSERGLIFGASATLLVLLTAAFPALVFFLALRRSGPQAIIDAEGIQLPQAGVKLAWEQVAEIKAGTASAMGLAILPREEVVLPRRTALPRVRSSNWLLVQDVMMAIAVETVVSTAIHARNARLQLVGEIDGAGRTGPDA